MNQNDFIKYIEELNISLTKLQLQQLNTYYEMLVEWNEKMNLTGITEKSQVYLKHFYDSLTICKVIDLTQEDTLCDIGTGAGFPGMVLKIVFPNLKVTLVDSLNKRLKFLNEVINKLNLNNIETIHARAEEYAKNHREQYDVVTARAVSSLPILLEYCTPLVKVGKYFISLKSNVKDELKDSENVMNKLSLSLIEQNEFLLPIENSIRTILKFQKEKKTLSIFPRKYSDMVKKHL